VRIVTAIATMNLSDHSSLLRAMNVRGRSITINQITDSEGKILTSKDREQHTLLSYRERGLSRSRNHALEAARSDIVVIADDDMHYESDYELTIAKAYDEFPQADVIIFHVDSDEPLSYKPPLKEGRVGFLRSMKIRSVQLTFRRKSLLSHGIRFDEEFGAGTHNYMGEENILLADCIAAGLKVYSVPVRIATLLESESTWFTGYTKRYFEIKGKVFYRMSPLLSFWMILQFIVRKTRLYKNDIKPNAAFLSSLNGLRQAMERKSIYFMGDFSSNNGPSIVNRHYMTHLRNVAYYCKSAARAARIFNFLWHLGRSKQIIISGVSGFHLHVIKIAKLLGKPTTYLAHGLLQTEYNINSVVGKDKELKIESGILKCSDIIICVSETFALALKASMPELSHKIAYVNNGVDVPAVQPSRKRKDHDHYTVMTVGGGVPRKNTLQVCQAIESMKDPSVKLIVVGPKDKYGDDIAKYPFVTYYESLPHDEVLAMMSSADLYIQNSTFETFGLAVCEAITRGCNLLVSRHVGATDVIEGLDERINIISDTSDIGDIARKIIRARKSTKLPTISSKADWNDAAQRLLRITKKGHL
jgi:glycosyltransferase involved in cell wall biosynthesis